MIEWGDSDIAGVLPRSLKRFEVVSVNDCIYGIYKTYSLYALYGNLVACDDGLARLIYSESR